MKLRTIRAKFLALVVPLVLLATVVVFGLFEVKARSDAALTLQEKLDKLVAIQSAVIAESLWNVADDQIKLILVALEIDRDVLAAAVIDEYGEVVAKIGAVENIDTQAFHAEIDIVYEYDDKTNTIGKFSLALTDASLQAAAHERMIFAGGLAAFLLVLVIVSALIGNRRTIGIPLERLLVSITQSRNDEKRHYVDWKSNDEIGAVVAAFNELQQRQQAYEQELRDARDTLELRVAERTRELDQAQRILIDAIESISEGFAIFDSTERLQICNTRFQSMFEYDQSDNSWQGSTYESFLRRIAAGGLILAAVGRVEEWLEEQRQQHTVPSESQIYQMKKSRWILANIHKTDERGTVAIYSDISELKQREFDLLEAKNQAEQANQTKSDFLAMMSHEIRTPMNGVIGMTNLMLNTKLDDEQMDFCRTINNSAESLLTIINDILDFSKVEAGRLELDPQATDLRQCIENAFDLITTKAAEEGIELVIVFENDTPENIFVDSDRLRQIVVNLLNNAINFTETGYVTLTMSTGGTDHNQRADTDSISSPSEELLFQVQDTGIGIPEQKISKLFQSFSQVDASTTRKYGGTGLGLTISKCLVELMGGTIWVESKIGEGTSFFFTITAPSVAPSPLNALDEENGALKSKRLLVVDDNTVSRSVIAQYADRWSISVQTCASPEEAISLITNREKYDIAIIDYHMPTKNGIELAEEIRKLEKGSALPLILLNSHRAVDNIDESKIAQFNFVARINKPVKRSALFDTLVDHFSDPESNNMSRRKTKHGILDESFAIDYPLRILLVDDNKTNRKLGTKILNRLGYAPEDVGSAPEAIDRLQEEPFDLVLMDIEMPDMDGVEATRKIRDMDFSSAAVHIIAMTANAMVGDRERYLRAGMDGYISKPIRLDALMAGIRNAAKNMEGNPEKLDRKTRIVPENMPG